MKLVRNSPPREFMVGQDKNILIKDCGSIKLDPDEQITFLTGSDKEYDVARKNWGYYATPSLNSRLKDQGFKTGLIKNSSGRYFVMIVETDKISEFMIYLKQEKSYLEQWLDEL